MANQPSKTPTVIGWREWICFPELGIDAIKAKVDTGARTSALHAYFVEPYTEKGQGYVRFGLHPIQEDNDTHIICSSPVVDQRQVTDSGGHKEQRYVIATPIRLGQVEKTIELTLTNRDTMKFRMLLGRTAIANDFWVDAIASYLMGEPSAN